MDTKKKNLILFPIGTVGRDMMYSLVTNFLLTYILFTKNLTSAQLFAITLIMALARVFDALNDPVMGNIIERTRTKWGKFKPWLLIGILSTSVVIYIVFNTSLSGWSFIALFAVFYFAYSITYTMHDISYWGMIPALSSDANARNQFTSRATLFAGIGGTLAAMLIPVLTTGEFALGGNAQTAYGRIALIIAILGPVFLAFTIVGVKERREDLSEPAPRVSFKKIVGTIRGNDQLLWIALIFLIQQIGNGLVLGGLGSMYIYFDFGYSGGLYSIFTTIGMAATAFLMIFYPALSRKWKRKEMMRVMAIVSVIGYVIMLGAGIVFPSGNMVKYWLIVLGYMLANLGQYGFYLIMMISIINTVEYNEWKLGTRDEAIIASLRPFLTKLAGALTVVATTVSYTVLGITKFTNTISDFEQQAQAGAISEAQKMTGITDLLGGVSSVQTVGLLITITLIPCVFMLASYFLYRKHYILDEEKYEEICTALGEKD